jgi:hypothetical protein
MRLLSGDLSMAETVGMITKKKKASTLNIV